MHKEFVDGLEDYLAGVRGTAVRQRFDAHLKICRGCRTEIQDIQEVSALLGHLRSPEAIFPSPGFYARISSRIESQRPKSFWSAFLEPAFGRRVAFASLMTLALLGTVLVSRESDYYSPPSAETVMAADQRSPEPENGAVPDRDMMLATLATYKP